MGARYLRMEGIALSETCSHGPVSVYMRETHQRGQLDHGVSVRAGHGHRSLVHGGLDRSHFVRGPAARPPAAAGRRAAVRHARHRLPRKGFRVGSRARSFLAGEWLQVQPRE